MTTPGTVCGTARASMETTGFMSTIARLTDDHDADLHRAEDNVLDTHVALKDAVDDFARARREVVRCRIEHAEAVRHEQYLRWVSASRRPLDAA